MEESFGGRKREISVDTLEQRLGAMTVVSAGYARMRNRICCFLPAGKPSPFPWVQIFLQHCDCSVFSQGFVWKAGAHGAALERQPLLLHPFPC